MNDISTDLGDSLIDTSDVSLRKLEQISASSLAHALRHVHDDERAGPVSAGFQSSIGTESESGSRALA
jgi:FXSXX-COOH protein